MSTYTQILYHVVFSTKDRERVLLKSGRDDLYRFIWAFSKSANHIFTASVAWKITCTC